MVLFLLLAMQSFTFKCFSFNSYVSFRYIQLSLSNRVATYFLERVAKSACHLFILWLLNCICLSFPLMLGLVWI